MATSTALTKADLPAKLPTPLQPLNELLALIRPEWQAKRLVQRVVALIPVDPSSACQRLLNAAIKDLQQKIVIAGIDLAIEAAKLNKLPPIMKADNILENYSTTNTLALAYRMGLVTPAGRWRRLPRAPTKSAAISNMKTPNTTEPRPRTASTSSPPASPSYLSRVRSS